MKIMKTETQKVIESLIREESRLLKKEGKFSKLEKSIEHHYQNDEDIVELNIKDFPVEYQDMLRSILSKFGDENEGLILDGEFSGISDSRMRKKMFDLWADYIKPIFDDLNYEPDVVLGGSYDINDKGGSFPKNL